MRRAIGKPARLSRDDQLANRSRPGFSTATRPRPTALFWALYLWRWIPPQPEVATRWKGATVDGTPISIGLKFTRAVIDETMRLYPPGVFDCACRQRPGYDHGTSDQEEGCHPDRAVAVAPARKTLARSERLHPVPFHDRHAARSLRLSAVRRRRARLHRRAFRAGRGNAGAGEDDRRVSRHAGRQGAGDADRRGNDTA